MPTNLPILIAAAGVGSRLGMNLPKCLVQVNGRSLLERLLVDVLASEPDVRLIVGFREKEVMAAALAIRSDITIVRNPAFRDTTVRHSFWLAARHIQGSCIIIDGDTLIEPSSYDHFCQISEHKESLVGISPARTTDAVYAETVGWPPAIKNFTRKPGSSHEWCGVAKLPARALDRQVTYVYECLVPLLPAQGHLMRTAEVDTPADLALACKLADQLDMPRKGQSAAAESGSNTLVAT
jgi:choline kinase